MSSKPKTPALDKLVKKGKINKSDVLLLTNAQLEVVEQLARQPNHQVKFFGMMGKLFPLRVNFTHAACRSRLKRASESVPQLITVTYSTAQLVTTDYKESQTKLVERREQCRDLNRKYYRVGETSALVFCEDIEVWPLSPVFKSVGKAAAFLKDLDDLYKKHGVRAPELKNRRKAGKRRKGDKKTEEKITDPTDPRYYYQLSGQYSGD